MLQPILGYYIIFTFTQFIGQEFMECLCNPFQYSCLENSMDKGTWWSMVHGVAKSWT